MHRKHGRIRPAKLYLPSSGSRSWSSENPDDEVPLPLPPVLLLLSDPELVELEVEDRDVLSLDVVESDVVWETDVVDELCCFFVVFLLASLTWSAAV